MVIFSKDKRGKNFIPGKLPWWTAAMSPQTQGKMGWMQRKSDSFLSGFSLQQAFLPSKRNNDAKKRKS